MSGGAPRDPLAFAYAEAAALTRSGDRDRYYATLFAPADRRPHLFALYAFNAELARVRDLVTDPLPGEVRLQWWQDLLEGAARGDAQAHPVAAALLETVAANRLPTEALRAMIEARTFDLYDDPMPTLHDLEGYCGETASAVIRLASIILAGGGDPGGAAAAGHAGVAIGLAGLLRNMPWHAAQGRVLLPEDLMRRHGVCRPQILAGKGGDGLARALADLRETVRGHLRQADVLMAGLDAAILPAFLPLALVEPCLGRMERRGHDPLHMPAEIPDWRKLLLLWRRARRAGA